MRKAEKKIKDRSSIDALIKRCRVCRLGLTDGDIPYIVPMCFGYDGQNLYFHCAPQGRKLDIIRRNDRVCFEFDIVESMIEAEVACDWGIQYKSVMGTGRAELLDDIEDKREALAALMAQYSPESYKFPEKNLDRTVIIKVAIETLSGKQS